MFNLVHPVAVPNGSHCDVGRLGLPPVPVHLDPVRVPHHPDLRQCVIMIMVVAMIAPMLLTMVMMVVVMMLSCYDDTARWYQEFLLSDEHDYQNNQKFDEN